jgi:glycosyltransferase involved in cell wall biosynthesis
MTSQQGEQPRRGALERRRRRIAFLGTRGVPAKYGGFETFVAELGQRLAANGDEITVYGRGLDGQRPASTVGKIRVVTLPAVRHKYLETVSHTLISAVHALTRRFDLIYICNVANVPAAAILLLFGRHVILNVDGLEWERKKWGALGRIYLRSCSFLAARLPLDLVTDAEVIERYYLTKHRRKTACIPYGARTDHAADDGTLARLGIEDGRYSLYVSRLEPENNAHVVIEAYRHVRTDLPLLVVGDAPYASAYIGQLNDAAQADPRVRLMGAIYGESYHVLQSHAACYVQATEVGGTHPALIEAMGHGAVILANDVPEHREVLGEAGLYYSGSSELAAAIQKVIDDQALRDDLSRLARERAEARYGWAQVTKRYSEWFDRLLAGPSADKSPL